MSAFFGGAFNAKMLSVSYRAVIIIINAICANSTFLAPQSDTEIASLAAWTVRTFFECTVEAHITSNLFLRATVAYLGA